MTLARNLGAVVLAAAWLLSVPQGTFSQANAQAQSPSPGPSDRTTAIPDQKLDAAAAVLERIASLKKDYEEQMVAAPASDKKRIAAEAFSAFQKAVTSGQIAHGPRFLDCLKRHARSQEDALAAVFSARMSYLETSAARQTR
jgi:hypothetical protein